VVHDYVCDYFLDELEACEWDFELVAFFCVGD